MGLWAGRFFDKNVTELMLFHSDGFREIGFSEDEVQNILLSNEKMLRHIHSSKTKVTSRNIHPFQDQRLAQ